jgi:pimeloyl-ACP methyl ester carboxylesterase
MEKKEVSIVLAHGAWADGSSWAHVITPLVSGGHKVLAAPLPLTSFDADVEAVEQTLQRIGSGPIVLVGHAYAGAVISAARSSQVRALVYISALAPDEGEKVADVFYRVPPHPRAPQLAPDNHGLIYLPDAAFAEAFAPNAGSEQHAVLAAVQRPISPVCITVPMSRPRWRDLPSWYLVCEQDYMILPENQRFMAQRMNAHVWTHDADHTPLVTAPGVVRGHHS